MIQASTPTHTFNIPFEAAVIDKLLITYAQNDVEVFSKTENDCALSGKSIQVTLTQEETLRFDADTVVQIQVRILTAGGDSIPSKIMRVPCSRVLNREVLA